MDQNQAMTHKVHIFLKGHKIFMGSPNFFDVT